MDRFLSNLSLDISSFWAGIILVLLALAAYLYFRKRIRSGWSRLSRKLLDFRDSLSITSDSDYTRAVHLYTQRLHLLSGQFPLEKILVPPRCAAPPPRIQPGVENFDSSLIQQSFGYDPTLPELYVEYFGPGFKLEEALNAGAHLCLIGQPGTGKTTAIADCIANLIIPEHEPDPEADPPDPKIPFYVQAHHVLAQFPNRDILGIILAALQANKAFAAIPNLPRYLTDKVNSGRAVLFIDGVDLLTYSDTNRMANFINAVCSQLPNLQLVTTASPGCLGNLPGTPLEFLPVLPWGDQEKMLFLAKFSRHWENLTSPESPFHPDQHSIRNSLLTSSDRYSTPLEFTLKSLAAFAGDLPGPSSHQILDLHLRRLLNQTGSTDALPAMEIFGLYSLLEQKSSLTRKDLNSWISSSSSGETPDLRDPRAGSLATALQGALDSGIIRRTPDGRYYFSHPTMGGLLAARGLSRASQSAIIRILDQPDWALLHETMRFFPAYNQVGHFINHMGADSSLFRSKVYRAGLWLGGLKQGSTEENQLLKLLTREIAELPIYMTKLRLITCLAKSSNPTVKNIFIHLQKSDQAAVRRCAAIGSGLIRDLSAVPALIALLNDSFPVSTAACYALGRIGSPRSLEAIADALLHGHELLRRAAAESLAQHRSEGHPALREGAKMDDLLVRYAVVHGLGLIKERWSLRILDKMRIDEKEWVVRDLAQQVFDVHLSGFPYFPQPKILAHEEPWLDQLSNRHGLPKPDGKNALELLLQALKVGTTEEKHASLSYLAASGTMDIIPAVAPLLNSRDPDLSQQAALAIWFNAPPRYQLPQGAV